MSSDNNEVKKGRDLDHKEFPTDALFKALLFLLAYYRLPYSKSSLLAGLPLRRGQLTARLFARAADRGGIRSKLVKANLKELVNENEPVVLLLRKHRCCVITPSETPNQFKLFRPEYSDNKSLKTIKLEELSNEYQGYALLNEKIHEFDDRANTLLNEQRESHWFWGVLSEALPVYGEVLMASFLINLFAVAVPLFVMNVYDRVVPNNAIETLWVLSLGMLIILGFEFIMRMLRGHFIDFAAKGVDIELSSRIVAQVLGLKAKDRPNSVGALASSIQAFDSFRDFITSTSVSLLVDLPFVLIFLAVIAWLGGWLVLVPALAVLSIAVVSYVLQKPLQSLVHTLFRYASEKNAVLVESLIGVDTIKCFNAEGLYQSRLEEIVSGAARNSAKLQKVINFNTSFAVLIQYLVTVLTVVFGVYTLIGGNLTLGGLIACVILAGRALAPIAKLSGIMMQYRKSITSLKQLDDLMRKESEHSVNKKFLSVPELKYEFQFDRVSFNYGSQEHDALNSVSFRIKPGQRIGLVGRAGSGKSSLLKLMLNLYTPTQGNVLVDGVDISQLEPAAFRSRIGYVPQQIVLFHGTIRDNITMGALDVSDEAVIEAAKVSGIYDFIRSQKEGLSYPVGEQGMSLSGGQRQAIGIARALLHSPEVYLLDEPTNSLDSISMQHFSQAFAKVSKGKTVVLVSHKLHLLNLVEYIVLLDHGKIVSHGPRDQFLKKMAGTRVP